MNRILIILSLIITGNVLSQEELTDPTPSVDTIQINPWKLTSLFGANGTQSSFINWNSGGRNNISLLGYISASADYNKDRFKWQNNISLALGGLQYIGKGNGDESLQKTDDRIELSSSIGHKFKKQDKIYLSFVGGFKTQTLVGFQFPNDSVPVSGFLAPGYFNLALGMDYTPNKELTIFLSPLAAKWTIVNDQRLANFGSFGVDPATYASNGTLLSTGKRCRSEFGAYFKLGYKKEIIKNIQMKSTVELFSNYLHNPQNIDVNADLLFTFKVNGWFSASLNWTLIYDDDINITTSEGGYGPRTQFKSVLGLGVSYTMKNFKEAEKKK